MSARRWTFIAFAALLISVTIGVGCNRARNDAQVAADVNQKIMADSNIPTKQISITSKDGVVTLAGNVGSEMERSAASNDAAAVDGVRTVVNNLTVAQPQASVPPPLPPDIQDQQPQQQAAAPSRKPSARHVASRHDSQPMTTAPASTPSSAVAPAPAPVAQAAPAPPPPPKPVTLDPGTVLSIRMIDPIDSDRNQIGDRFHATLDTPISINDQVVVPAGADIEGRVAELRTAGHFTGQSQVALELTSLGINGRRYNIHTDQYSRQGTSRGKNTAEKVGGAAAVGAIIGAIAGGGKGAAIGTVVGAGAGGGVQAATKAQQIHIKPEQLLSFKLENPLTVTPQGSVNRASHTSSDYGTNANNNTNSNTNSNTKDYSEDQGYQQPEDTNRPVLKRRDQQQN